MLLATAVSSAILATSAFAHDHGSVKIGLLLGFTGPAESLAPAMAAGAELAFKEATDSGKFLDGKAIEVIRADSTCVDASAATAAAERLATSDKVASFVGALCSGATGAILQGVARTNGLMMISPSATSPALTTAEDDDLFFRVSPSDARQGEIIAQMLIEQDIKSAALTYTNNDYGKGLADSIQTSYEGLGGKITLAAAHEDGKGDYNAEVGALSSAGGDMLVVVGYLDQGGKGIIQSSLDTGAFDQFFLPDAMIGESIFGHFGADIDGSIGSIPGTDSDGAATYSELATAAGFEAGPYSGESYDAAALTLLAMQAAGSSASADAKAKVFDVANAPGEKIYPGELAKGLEILASGGEIDYVGATSVELIGPGEAAGSYREIVVEGGTDKTVKFRQ